MEYNRTACQHNNVKVNQSDMQLWGQQEEEWRWFWIQNKFMNNEKSIIATLHDNTPNNNGNNK